MITYCRIEAKLIHGQTTTVLKSFYPCDGIILVDDITAADLSMKKIFTAATPHGIKSYFFNLEDGIRQLQKAETSEYNYFVIFRNPIEVGKIIKMGYRFPVRITCGQQFVRSNTHNIMLGIGLTEEEIQALEYIVSMGSEVVFDPSCKNENLPWTEIKKNIDLARMKASRNQNDTEKG